MNAPDTRSPRQRLGCLLLATAAALGIGLMAPHSSSADASGCTLYPETEPLSDATCGYPGPGCYFCEYNYLGQPGYTQCAESPDGTIKRCKTGVVPQHQYSGSLAGGAPITPAQGVSGSPGALFAIAPIEASQAPK